MVKFPFYKQETNYTCGAASMRMALEFFGIKKSEKQIAKLLNTNKVRGTWHKDFPLVAERFCLSYVDLRNATIRDLKTYHKKGFVIILCYFFPEKKFDHYSVLKKINERYVYFWDPLFGKNHKYPIKHFKKIWRSDPKYENEKHWFFAVKKE
ncbi:MAG: C39 family peptidase [Nanoarchaeota archaeon]|nr:C39 family peptidase [Nanoarchaeota archaeon]